MNNEQKKLGVILATTVMLIIFISSIIANSNDNTTLPDVPDKQTTTPVSDDTNYNESVTKTSDNSNVSSKKKKNSSPKTKKKKKKSKKQLIKDTIEDRLWEYDYVTLDHISVNDDYGTKKKNDYIALVYLTWDQKNSASLSKEMLTMYSEDLSAYIGKKRKNVQEIAIFWTVPYLNNGKAKLAYERKGKYMHLSDKAYDANFQ